jgi:hypothetical protein
MTDKKTQTLTLTLSPERQAALKSHDKVADAAMGLLKRRLDELEAQARTGELTHSAMLNGLGIVRLAGGVASTQMLRIAGILHEAEAEPEGGPGCDESGGANGRRLQ